MKRLFLICALLLILANVSAVAFAAKAEDDAIYMDVKNENVLKIKTTKTKYLNDTNLRQ